MHMVAILVAGSGISKTACGPFLLLCCIDSIRIYAHGGHLRDKSGISKTACNPFFFFAFLAICAHMFVICMC
jgi:hypothetical protein